MHTTTKKIVALAKFLDVTPDEIEESKYNPGRTFTYGTEEYQVLTDDEATEAARWYILDSVWAFPATFLESHSDVADAKTFRLLQTKCEDANASILRLLRDPETFVKDAIRADGRGHFLNSWDNEEYEQDGFLIYGKPA